MRVLSKGDKLPFINKSVGWDESTNFKDYDLVFVNMRSLEDSASDFDHPYNESEDSPKVWDSSDVKNFINTGGHIVVYLPNQPVVEMGETTTKKKETTTTPAIPRSRGGGSDDTDDEVEPYSEYELLDWLPFSVDFDLSESGESVNVQKEKWAWYFGSEFPWEKTIDGPSHDSSFTQNSIAMNSYDKDISIVVAFDYGDDGTINLIPPDSSISYSKFVSDCLKNVFNYELDLEGSPPPSWASTRTLPGEEEIRTEIAKKKDRIQELESELESITSYKQLLYETSDPLEKITREALQKIGFDIDGKVPGKRDGVLHTSEKKYALEISGTSGGIKLSKVRQLDDWVENLTAEHPDEEVSGLLVINPEMGTPPEERDITVEPNVENYIHQRGNYKILTTLDLYQLIKFELDDEISKDEVEQIFDQDGPLLTIPDKFQQN